MFSSPDSPGDDDAPWSHYSSASSISHHGEGIRDEDGDDDSDDDDGAIVTLKRTAVALPSTAGKKSRKKNSISTESQSPQTRSKPFFFG